MTDKIKHGDSFPFHPQSNGDDHCAVCNRKLGKNPLGVEVTNGGDVHDPAVGAADTNDNGYMGFWLVGSECAKVYAPGIATRS
jgi:hypothetical protein